MASASPKRSLDLLIQAPAHLQACGKCAFAAPARAPHQKDQSGHSRMADEVGATRTMLTRTRDRFDLSPDRWAADTVYGSGNMLGWLVDQDIEPHAPVIDRSDRKYGTFCNLDFSYKPKTDELRELTYQCRSFEQCYAHQIGLALCDTGFLSNQPVVHKGNHGVSFPRKMVTFRLHLVGETDIRRHL